MRRSLACIGIGTVLVLVWIAARTFHLENELASLRRQIAAEKMGPQGPRGSKGEKVDATATLSIEPDVSIEPTLSFGNRFESISFSKGKMEFHADSGDTAVSVEAEPKGGGSFRVLDRDGQHVAFMGTTNDGRGLFELEHGKNGAALTLSAGQGGGYARFNSRRGHEIAYLGATQLGNGLLELSNSEKNEVVTLGSGDGGYAWFRNRQGHDNAFLGTSDQGPGLLQLFKEKTEVVNLSGGSYGGYLRLNDKAGKEIVFIGADTAGRGSLFINETRALDYAEVFELARREGVFPGTVMAIATNSSITVSPTAAPYERRVVGVISGAGALQPGTVIGARADGTSDLPIAVSGQVYVRVCSETGLIEPGDLLVASTRPGVAMKARSSEKAVGAVIGKALESFSRTDGKEGLIRMLVMLR